MLVGVPKEIKDNEYRVGLVPSTVRELTANGHRVLVEKGAGLGAGLADADYEAAGAEIVADADQVFGRAELIVKVKEPLAPERKMLRAGQVLFTYLHLAPDPQQTADLDGRRRHRHRLRDGDQPAGHLAAAHADVGGRRPHGAACRRALPGEGEWWPRRAARRRARRAARRRRRPRRRCRRQPCRAHRRRHGRDGHRGRPQSGSAAPHRQSARRARAHRVLHPRRGRDALPARRSGHRLGADPGRRSAQADQRRDGARR